MINVSRAFRQELYNNRRNYLSYADITLQDGTVLNLTNEDMLTGGFSREEAVSDDGSFSALGSAIIGSATLSLNNMHDDYTVYDFTDADVVLYLGLNVPNGTGTRLEKFKVGTYTVDETGYSGSAVTLSMLDYMEQFDRPYSTSQLAYPASLGEIVRDACLNCGVTLLTQSFPHSTYVVSTRPTDDAVTYREVIGWAAAIAGCFAKCDVHGRLEIKWFNQSALEYLNQGYDGGVFDTNSTSRYTTGDALDGGTFNPWSNGSTADGGLFTDDSQIHIISSLYSQDLSIDDVVITGVRAIVKAEDSEGKETDKPYMRGAAGYVVEISGNEFITVDNAQEIVNWLGDQLIGLRFRKANVTHASDPSIEAGDVAILWDKKGHDHPILVTRMSFAVGSSQTIVCGAETPSRNSAKRFGSSTKAFVEARKMFKSEKTARETALQSLMEAISTKEGLYATTETTASGDILYLHDQPNLADSATVWKMTQNAFAVTTNYNHGVDTVWNAGLTVDGTLIAQIMSTIGLNFEWGTGGTLTLGGENNVNGLLRMLDASGNQVGEWKNTGLTAKSLTADDYIYVDGNQNSFFRIPLYPYDGNHYFQISDGGIEIHNYASEVYNGFSPSSPAAMLAPSDTVITMGATYTNRDSVNAPPIKIAKASGEKWSHYYPNSIYVHDAPGTSGGQTNTYESQLTGYGLHVEDTTGSIRAHYGAEKLYVREIIARDAQGVISPGEITVMGSTGGQGLLNMRYADMEFNQGGSIKDVRDITCYGFSIWGTTKCYGDVTVTGTKNRLVETDDYGERLLYCYETPTPMFGDVGEGVIGEDGLAYIQIDPTFLETIATTQYQIFLQAYGDGKAYVKERHESYFVVEGTAGLVFGWELKAKQRDYENYRLEKKTDGIDNKYSNYGAFSEEAVTETEDFGDSAVRHIDEIAKERGVAA